MTDVTRIRVGRLIEVVAGEVLTDQLLIARGERIESVGPYDDGPVDVDLSNHTVLPGLIDCHAHLIGEVESGHGYAALVQRTGAQEALSGVRNARDTIMAGFTSVRDVGTFRAFVDVALRDAIEAGDVLGPRMLCAGAYVTSSGGGGDVTGLARATEINDHSEVGIFREPLWGLVGEAQFTASDFARVWQLFKRS